MKECVLVFPIAQDLVGLARKKNDKVVGSLGKLTGWGGKLEPTDLTPEECACREFTEESLSKARPEALKKVAEVSFFRATVPVFFCHVYLLYRFDGAIQETETMGPAEFYRTDLVPYRRMMPGDVFWMPPIFAGRRGRAEVHYDAGNETVLEFNWKEPL